MTRPFVVTVGPQKFMACECYANHHCHFCNKPVEIPGFFVYITESEVGLNAMHFGCDRCKEEQDASAPDTGTD